MTRQEAIWAIDQGLTPRTVEKAVRDSTMRETGLQLARDAGIVGRLAERWGLVRHKPGAGNKVSGH